MKPDTASNTESALPAEERRPYTFDRVVRLLIGALAVVAVYWLLKTLKSVILPFLIAWLIAYVLEPFVQYNKRLLRVKNRWLPIGMTLFEVVLIICAISVFIVPSVINEAHLVADFIGRYVSSENEIPLYVVFIMLDYEKLLKGIRGLVMPKYRKRVFTVVSDIKQSMNHYFRGQSLVAFIVGILFCIGFSIVGLPLAVVMGLFIGVLNMVPYLQLISLVPVTILCLVSSVDSGIDFWSLWISCMVVYIVVQCIQDLFLTPKIMGKAMGLNPALILLSLSVWGTLLGFVGLIIALPLTTLLLAYYNMFLQSRERRPRTTT